MRVDITLVAREGSDLGQGSGQLEANLTSRFYRIRVDGVLGVRLAAAVDAFRVERGEGFTVLSGECIDSAVVFGVLERIKALGLDLLEVTASATTVHGRRIEPS